MTEVDYINIVNLTRISSALDILRGLHDVGVVKKYYISCVRQNLAKMQEELFLAVKTVYIEHERNENEQA